MKRSFFFAGGWACVEARTPKVSNRAPSKNQFFIELSEGKSSHRAAGGASRRGAV
jgi:hypothetical protein